jgi:hypothetical protein
MVERLIVYADDDRSEIQEVRESFSRRKDKLRERRVYPLRVSRVGGARSCVAWVGGELGRKAGIDHPLLCFFTDSHRSLPPLPSL